MALLTRKLCALFLVGCVLCAPSAHAAVFYPEHYTLANGVQLVLIKNKLSTAVGHMVWYKVGAVDEVAGKTGIAHYLEHMMFKGTKKIPAGKFHEVIASKGGNENAFTSSDYTAYHEVIAKEHLGLVMQMEADRMRGLTFTEEQAEKEKSVVLSERQQRTENSPSGVFYEKLGAAVFPSYPYGRPVIGHRADIEGLSSQDLMDFYKKYYVPSNVIVVVSGNVDTKEALRLAAGTYGRIKASEKVSHAPFPKVQPPTQKELVHEDARVRQPFAVRRILAPSYKQNPKESLALDVLLEVLEAEVGLLHQQFIVKERAASGLSVSYDGMTRGASVFAIASTPVPGGNVHQLEKDIMSYLERLAKKGVAAKQVRSAKQRMLDTAVFARDKLMAPAQVLGSTLAVGLPLSAVEQWPRNIQNVTASQVTTALRKLVASPHQIVGVLKPTGETK